MSFSSAVCTSFKEDLFNGLTNVPSNTFYVALYLPSADLSAATTSYTSEGEVSGAGYTAGGYALENPSVWTDGSVVGIDFDDFTTSIPVTISNIGGLLIYNSSNGNRAVCVIQFPQSVNLTSQNFTIVFPEPNQTNGLLAFRS